MLTRRKRPRPDTDAAPEATPARPPLPEGVFPSVRAAWEEHDETCASLRYLWLGRRGGVSCPSDLWSCDGCEVTFYLEGLAWVNYEAVDAGAEEDDVRLCGCCARRRGFVVAMTPYGLTRLEGGAVPDT